MVQSNVGPLYWSSNVFEGDNARHCRGPKLKRHAYVHTCMLTFKYLTGPNIDPPVCSVKTLSQDHASTLIVQSNKIE